MMNIREIIDDIDSTKLYRLYTYLRNPEINYGVDKIVIDDVDVTGLLGRDEYISTDQLIKISGLSIDVIEETIPLIHSLQSIYSYDISVEEEFIDLLSTYIEEIYRWRSQIKKLYSEDSRKKNILLLIPSEKQFSNVRGNWRDWIWSEKTYTGVETPTFEGWINDILNLSETLKSEGVNTILAVDSDGADQVMEVYKDDIIQVDIPPNLPKIGYVRDQSLTWTREPIIGSMALNIRRGEEDIIIKVYREIGLNPIYKVGWEVLNNRVVMPYLEGGNFIVVDGDGYQVIFTGVGVRGSNHATFKALSRILPSNIKIYGVPISAYIRRWRDGAVHLDVVMMYLGELNGVKTLILDPSRMSLYSFLEYIPETNMFKLRNGLTVFKELGIEIDEPPRESSSKVTMVNALNLGGGKILVDRYNGDVNRYLRKYGVDIIEVDIPHIEAGGGGIRCASKELWI